jgi:hypothetical protein
MSTGLSLERYYQWGRRLYNPVAGLLLDFGSELWAPLRDHPAYDWVVAQSRTDSVERNDADIGYFLTRNLLANVVHAAGGIEYTVEKIKTAIRSAQASLDENPFPPGPVPELGRGFSDVPVDHANYEFLNLLAWTKSLEERLDRRVPGSKTMRLGLLPALAPNTMLRPRVLEAVAKLRKEALDIATRYLANFAGHASAIPYPGTAAKVSEDDRIVIPIPDPPSNWVELFDQLKYTDGRDLESFAEELLAAVERFMDSLLGAFEDAAQVRRLEPEKFFLG